MVLQISQTKVFGQYNIASKKPFVIDTKDQLHYISFLSSHGNSHHALRRKMGRFEVVDPIIFDLYSTKKSYSNAKLYPNTRSYNHLQKNHSPTPCSSLFISVPVDKSDRDQRKSLGFCSSRRLSLPNWSQNLRKGREEEIGGFFRLSARSPGSDASYLTMWKRAREREEMERKEKELELSREEEERRAEEEEVMAIARRQEQFSAISQVPEEERQKVERQQIVDRASAALAAVESVLADVDRDRLRKQGERGRPTSENQPGWRGGQKLALHAKREPIKGPAVTARLATPANSSPPSTVPSTDDGFNGDLNSSHTLGKHSSPGPDFWTWAPPPVSKKSDKGIPDRSEPKLKKQTSLQNNKPSYSVLELDRAEQESFELPLESESAATDLLSIFQARAVPSLPPLQSLLEIEQEAGLLQEVEVEEARALEWANLQVPDLEGETSRVVKGKEESKEESGFHEDGSRWWRETGVEARTNGEVCNWTIVRGVSADGSTEWEEKWWETTDPFDYKELGAEKSGRDSNGGVWRETWREAMWQDAKNGLLHIEKSADKWARNGSGGEWHEKWWEHYDGLGHSEKWADKWSKIDLSTPLEAGHAHIWHERWGEEYDGKGAATKYTDKWAERFEADGSQTKWGDKWDERFDRNANGRKGGETWWEGSAGERWNRTWGEDHNGSGFVHKYGQSSSGEHWDTTEAMDTKYERKPHYGFRECLDHSRRLQELGKKKQKPQKRTL